ncbi:MAG: aminoacyl-tRNA hydrolase [Oscillospiraceae bacterium]|nr:aminoacyl-tRNA hydrolase [Oscillospiraceae bacterium]
MLFSRKNATMEWLVFCLGNAGGRYDNTRHNTGFLVADELGELWDIPIQRLKYKAMTGTTDRNGHRVMLLKPTTLMNLSGQSVHEAASFFKVPAEHVLVVCDDISLPLGKVRVRPSGSAGGHNGLKSVIQHLGTDQFPRVRVGVGGKPHPDYDLADWVLGRFTPKERQTLDPGVKKAAEAVDWIVSGHDISSAMNRYN